MTYPRRAPRAELPTRVEAVHDVTASMRQIDLVGPDVPRLRLHPGAHLVVLVPTATAKARRVYSIWRHTPAESRLSLRIAVHDGGGPGCDWARRAAPGDRVTVEPPRSKITVVDAAAFHLFAGDETGAVPLLAMRAALRTGARPVIGVFECAGPQDEMPGRDGVPPLPWVHRGTASAVASRVLQHAVHDLAIPSAGTGAAYIAGESETCRLIQRTLIEHHGFPRRAVHVQPQWTAGRPGFGAG
ncbi:siderophore-interacting protein [Dactylosporangium matsuzakiense]|uniref:siderophore-interacting protein n=1 Tax=Dactylosporangium matsuzakiense TaxID=53360 RepID=UPI0021C2E927|nr:siderophore-interacting protein [Dactylosporangium matsuzakiense]UWZ42609.1 siderophore-interacting protein [Dactylosporangium matsuzakiense]